MRLSEVLPAGIAAPPGADSIHVTGITAASAAVGPGAIFAGLPGSKIDGASFAADAIERGARAIVVGKGSGVTVPDGVALIEVENPRALLAKIAARFAGAQPRCAVAVTGTSGKTSVADFTRQIFASLGHSAASIGTIGIVKPGGAIYGSLTTPDPVTLHAMLAELAGEGVTHLAFEASSHGLDQHRLDGVELAAAAFTNLGRDHMDYHPSLEAYLKAKLRLFTELLDPGRPAVINSDGAEADKVSAAAKARGLRILTVGTSGETLKRTALNRDGFQQVMGVSCEGQSYEVRLPLVGSYQAENALVAAGLAIAVGEKTADVLAALSDLKGVPGRLEIVGERNGGLVVIDYAHKPEALAAALDACRPFATGRLISVFGCGGDRDKGKRPIMGSVSVEKADVTIVTDDNPRTETAADIRSQILAGAPGAKEIGDRAEAIQSAIAMMMPGDVVLIAGKGHETGQIIGNRVVPFSDHDEVRRALQG
jgi:UDP-N-acetylmuramoyl-L-alanyl-D-glutamate--2,6-diaminopimelate ligase